MLLVCSVGFESDDLSDLIKGKPFLPGACRSLRIPASSECLKILLRGYLCGQHKDRVGMRMIAYGLGCEVTLNDPSSSGHGNQFFDGREFHVLY